MKHLLTLLSVLIFQTALNAQIIPPNAFQQLNSAYDEANPVLHPDSKTLYFTIAHHPDNIGGKKDPGDIWYSKLQEDQTWSAPMHAGAALNNRQYNAVAGFSADGAIMYLHNHYTSSGEAARTQGIAMSRRTAAGWSAPENIAIPYFLNRSAIQSGSISGSGKYFVFAADSYGSFGAEDLYVCTYQNGRWSEPCNLGVIINSAFQEMSPFLAADDVTLYFSTNGRGGKGSFDVYTSTRLDDSWTNWSIPQNLAAVNTSGRELFFTLSADHTFALYTSTQNSDGYGDVKFWIPDGAIILQEPAVVSEIISEPVVVNIEQEIELPVEEPKHEIKEGLKLLGGLVLNQKTNEPVKANLKIRSNDFTENISTLDNGSFELNIIAADVYWLDVSAAGYISKSFQVNDVQDQASIQVELLIEPAEIGTLVNLKNVLFERSTDKLLPDSFPELDMIAQFLLENPSIEIELAGHTDNRGTQSSLMKLSNERVAAVKKYLVEKGVSAARISGKGYGGTRPITDNYAEESRRLNRRVEFTIVKN